MKAIVDMPNPTDVAGVQRLLGLAQYLAKFLPHLSDITKPLRELTRNDTDWMWESSQQNAVDTLKKAVASTPVLRYYNLADEVTIQCDASQSGLGAALMQNGLSAVHLNGYSGCCSVYRNTHSMSNSRKANTCIWPTR